jgi:hypothetical protein
MHVLRECGLRSEARHLVWERPGERHVVLWLTSGRSLQTPEVKRRIK